MITPGLRFFAFGASGPPGPEITLDADLSPFAQSLPTPSPAQTYGVSATGLTANLIISAPEPFQIRTAGGGGYGTALEFVPVGGKVSENILIRMNAGSSGAKSGNVAHNSVGATPTILPVSGTAT